MRRRRSPPPPSWHRRAIPASRPPTVARQPLVPRAGAWDGGGALPAPSDWLRASGRRSAIGPRGCLARGRARWGGAVGSCWKSGGGAGAGGRGRGRGRGTRGRGGGVGAPKEAERVTAPGPSPAPPRALRPRAASGQARRSLPRPRRRPAQSRASGAGGRSARQAMATTSTTGSTLLQPLSNAVQLPIDQVPEAAPLAPRPRRPLRGRVPSARKPGPGTRGAGWGGGEGRRRPACYCPLAAWRPLSPRPQLPTQPPPRPGSPRGHRAPTCARACLALLPATAAPDPGRACTA